MSIFSSLFGPRSFLGVDIGTTSIKIVELTKKDYRPQLKNYGFMESYGHLERLNNAIQTSSLKIAEKETADLLRTLVSQSKFKTTDAIASIPSFAAFITLLEFPQMGEAETASTMQYQARQYIPLPISEVTLDWFKVGEKTESEGFIKQQILLISVPNEIIKRYQNIFKLAGLKLRALEIESLSLIRSLNPNDGKPAIIADIGSRSTNIVATDKDGLKYNYQTDFSGSSITQALASGLGINIRRAEQIKKEKGFLAVETSNDLSTLMTPFLDAILNEIKRAKDSYEKSFGTKIEKIILTGGGAKLIGIADYVQKRFNLPAEVGESFSKVDYPAGLEPIIRQLGPSFSVAVGLGIREFIK